MAFHACFAYIHCMANRLSASDREFFAAVADVVFGNPFSARRAELIGRLAPDTKLSDAEALVRVAAPRLTPWLKEGAPSPQLSAEDRRLLEPALLYLGYHRAIAQLDALIERQSKQ